MWQALAQSLVAHTVPQPPLGRGHSRALGQEQPPALPAVGQMFPAQILSNLQTQKGFKRINF